MYIYNVAQLNLQALRQLTPNQLGFINGLVIKRAEVVGKTVSMVLFAYRLCAGFESLRREIEGIDGAIQLALDTFCEVPSFHTSNDCEGAFVSIVNRTELRNLTDEQFTTLRISLEASRLLCPRYGSMLRASVRKETARRVLEKNSAGPITHR